MARPRRPLPDWYDPENYKACRSPNFKAADWLRELWRRAEIRPYLVPDDYVILDFETGDDVPAYIADEIKKVFKHPILSVDNEVFARQTSVGPVLADDIIYNLERQQDDIKQLREEGELQTDGSTFPGHNQNPWLTELRRFDYRFVTETGANHYVEIDLFASDAQLLEDFKKHLAEARERLGPDKPKSVSETQIGKMRNGRILEIIDLLAWERITGQEVTRASIADLFAEGNEHFSETTFRDRHIPFALSCISETWMRDLEAKVDG